MLDPSCIVAKTLWIEASKEVTNQLSTVGKATYGDTSDGFRFKAITADKRQNHGWSMAQCSANSK